MQIDFIPRSTLLIVAVLASACHSAAPTPTDRAAVASNVERRFLSGAEDDWEPSLALGPRGAVYVIATRRVRLATDTSMVLRTALWASADNGKTFTPAVFPDSIDKGQGDARVAVDGNGTVFVSWLGRNFYGMKQERGGALNLAISRDQGRTFAVRTIASGGVSDKPELVVSPSGRDVYVAFEAFGGPDIVASHDGGATWARHKVAPTAIHHNWPTAIALGPDGAIWLSIPVVVAKTLTDSITDVTLNIKRSTDGGVTWRDTVLAHGPRVRKGCVHDHTAESCGVKLPYPGVAVDAKNNAYVVYVNGAVQSRYALYFTRSTDGGRTWSAADEIVTAKRPKSGDLSDAGRPAVVAAADGHVYLVWSDDRDGPVSVFTKYSSDGGRHWSPDVRLSRPDQPDSLGYYGHYGGQAIDPSGALHVAWSEGTRRIGSGRGGTWYARWAAP